MSRGKHTKEGESDNSGKVNRSHFGGRRKGGGRIRKTGGGPLGPRFS